MSDYNKIIKHFQKSDTSYINNTLFEKACLDYQANPNDPAISDYVGACILWICNKFIEKKGLDQSKRDGIISNGCLYCLKNIENFKEGKNAYSFFYTNVNFAYLDYMKKAKRRADINNRGYFTPEGHDISSVRVYDTIYDYKNKYKLSKDDLAQKMKKQHITKSKRKR